MPEPAIASPRGARPSLARLVTLVAGTLLVGFLALPFVGLILRVTPGELFSRLGSPLVLDALRLSLVTSLAATTVVAVFGVPVAYVLATREFKAKRVVEVLVDLPMVLPPTVAGFALLMAFGRAGLAGQALGALGLSLPFTTLGVVVAQVFMSVPFIVGPARASFAGLDPRLLDAAATLRAGETFTFFHVALPLAMPGILAGVAMSGARALGEFGATITFAGNLPGSTQTMPLAVYVALQSDLDAAVALSVLLLVMAFGLLLGLRAAPVGSFWGPRRALAQGR
jgi:molybdate transport system permease protein